METHLGGVGLGSDLGDGREYCPLVLRIHALIDLWGGAARESRLRFSYCVRISRILRLWRMRPQGA
jgi:hypothetical protein